MSTTSAAVQIHHDGQTELSERLAAACLTGAATAADAGGAVVVRGLVVGGVAGPRWTSGRRSAVGSA
ncbi:MAG TPA: hypothetical protein VLL25_05525, partial [Acidimicrobiales bacterium]|nr:hypothetical protein [Acidimicrobiales bacterium]